MQREGPASLSRPVMMQPDSGDPSRSREKKQKTATDVRKRGLVCQIHTLFGRRCHFSHRLSCEVTRMRSEIILGSYHFGHRPCSDASFHPRGDPMFWVIRVGCVEATHARVRQFDFFSFSPENVAQKQRLARGAPEGSTTQSCCIAAAKTSQDVFLVGLGKTETARCNNSWLGIRQGERRRTHTRRPGGLVSHHATTPFSWFLSRQR